MLPVPWEHSTAAQERLGTSQPSSNSMTTSPCHPSNMKASASSAAFPSCQLLQPPHYLPASPPPCHLPPPPWPLALLVLSYCSSCHLAEHDVASASVLLAADTHLPASKCFTRLSCPAEMASVLRTQLQHHMTCVACSSSLAPAVPICKAAPCY